MDKDRILEKTALVNKVTIESCIFKRSFMKPLQVKHEGTLGGGNIEVISSIMIHSL